MVSFVIGSTFGWNDLGQDERGRLVKVVLVGVD
jgi:hypothetical protein